jgi:hypothetical protein
MTIHYSPPREEPAAWKKADFTDAAEYTLELKPEEQAEVRAAVEALAATGRLRPVHELTQADFPFRQLGERLCRGFEDVRAGRGFVLIRGVPYDGWDLDHYAAAVWGIGAWFGHALSQNAQGELLGHVLDASREDPTPRMYRSSFELGLHNDPTAMLSLACWNPALSGGDSVIASGITIHDEIARRAPHLLEPLYRGFHYHRLGEEAPGQETVTPFRVPVFAERNSRISCRNTRAGYIAGHHELGIPVTEEELEAINLFDEIAREPENHVVITLQRGDMVIVNNYVLLHARTGFDDHDDPERQRHLLRLWLDAEGFRDVPEEFWQFVTANGVPAQPGRRCTYDFKKLFAEVPPELLRGRGPRKTLSEIVAAEKQ